jgi:GAF domain-containing protein
MMKLSNSSSATQQNPVVIEGWPMNLGATRAELDKAKKRLERYQAVLRLASAEIEQRNRFILALTTFARQAGRAAKQMSVLKLALVQALETIGAPVGAVLLVHPITKDLNIGVHKGLTGELVDVLTGKELNKGAMALMPHLVAGNGALLEFETTDDSNEKLLLAAGRVTSLVSLPLLVGSNLLGALLVGLSGKKIFKPSELCFLMALSQETAIVLDSLSLREGLWHTAEALLGGKLTSVELEAVQTADELTIGGSPPIRLSSPTSPPPQPTDDDLEHLLAAMMEAEDEVQEHNTDLQTLNTISEMMNSTLDLKKILECAVDQTRTTLNTDAAWLYLLDGADQLRLRACAGLSDAYARGMQCLSLDTGLEGQVASQNKPGFIQNIAVDPRFHKIWVDKEGLEALAAVPLTCPETGQDRGNHSGSKVVGVLAVGMRTRSDPRQSPQQSESGYIWTPRQIRLLTSIANQVALAISNARLYARLHDSELEARTGNEVLHTINDMLLEKNSFLEGFVQNDLITALVKAAEILRHMLTAAPTAQDEKENNDISTLQEIINRLEKQAKETGDIITVLDVEFDHVLNNDDEEKHRSRTIKPVRLQKMQQGSASAADHPASAPKVASPLDSTKSHSASTAPHDDAVKPMAMSFEEAVAAGLVPSHIIEKEMK